MEEREVRVSLGEMEKMESMVQMEPMEDHQKIIPYTCGRKKI